MQKITFHNNQNGLEYTFAADTPRALLVEFDGNSLGAEFVQFKPVGFDGSKTSSYTLNARTITFTADWYAVEGGKRSREKALAEWDKMQYVFAPGQTGILTWTNGVQTRTIECYANETPAIREKVRGLFSAEFTLTADHPLWRGEEHSVVLNQTNTDFIVTNTCPIVVPPIFTVEAKQLVVRVNGNFIALGGSDTYLYKLLLDCEKRRAVGYYSASSYEPAHEADYSRFVNPSYSYPVLNPGENIVRSEGGSASVTVTWHDRYLGVGK